ncbi:hypothetical protein TRFO_19411 [Tritrichomonas foetus]|uniref:C2 NT-type domain-containing protein n=1 Tax=Tritrichomonas foetus TaxID=1144522 RepID=A0A1J4KI08_9EUKA|nr:hypothetical protein TRFO_19411 [Tritrichomonas foetus]|eukprot:OHT11023.1 hypothetical protein TRFO_19411 [Tritrichomonas foetus]
MSKRLFKTGWKKYKALVVFTIHTVKLPQSFGDGFRVEWYRGNLHGQTEKVYCNDHSELVFENRFRFNTKFKINEKEKTIRPKYLSFVLKRFIFFYEKKKTYGKLQLNISTFLFFFSSSSSPLTSLFQLESPFVFFSFMLLTVQASCVESISNESTNTLTDYKNLTSSEYDSMYSLMSNEYDGEWDTSDPIFNNIFFENISSNHLINTNLSNNYHFFLNISQNDSNDDQNDSNDDFFFSNTDQSRLNDDLNNSIYFFFNICNSTKSQNQFPELSGFERISKTPKRSLKQLRNSSPYDFEVADTGNPYSQKISNFLAPRPKKVNLTQQGTINFLKSVLMEEWETITQFNNNQSLSFEFSRVPKSSSVIFAAICHSQILEEGKFSMSIFQQIEENFTTKFEVGKFIKSSQIDKFVVIIYLLALIKKESTKTNDKISSYRVNKIMNSISEAAFHTIDQFIKDFFYNFQCFIDDLLNAKNDSETLLYLFLEKFELFLSLFTRQDERGKFSEDIKSFLIRRFFEHFDAFLLNSVICSKRNCTFSNSVVWNSFASLLNTRYENSLTYFRESATVLQMSKQITQNPFCMNDICPHLTGPIILTLLKHQTSDEYHNEENDLSLFIKYTKNDSIVSDLQVQPLSWNRIEEIVMELNTENWKEFSFDQKTARVFPFLSDYFHVY